VHRVHTVGGAEPLQPGNRRPTGSAPSAEDQTVVAQLFGPPVRAGHGHRAAARVDAFRAGVQTQTQVGGFQVGAATVRRVRQSGTSPETCTTCYPEILPAPRCPDRFLVDYSIQSAREVIVMDGTY
jgi:hypothetical protein